LTIGKGREPPRRRSKNAVRAWKESRKKKRAPKTTPKIAPPGVCVVVEKTEATKGYPGGEIKPVSEWGMSKVPKEKKCWLPAHRYLKSPHYSSGIAGGEAPKENPMS
jgi:hypothetical protein